MKKFFRPGRRTVVFAAVVFILAMLARMPASLVTLALPQEIRLQNVEGTLWNGKASAAGINGMLVQERLAWQFRPQALLSARLQWDVSGRFADRNSRLAAILGAGGIVFSGADITLPLEPLATLDPKLKPLQLGAVLRATAKTIAPGNRWDAAVTIERLFSALAPQGELGNYRLDLRGEPGGKGTWQLATVSGVLQAKGSGTFDAQQSVGKGQITLVPQNQMPGLTPALSALPKAGEGYQIAF